MDRLLEIKQLLKSTQTDFIAKGILLCENYAPAQALLHLYESIWSMTYACSTEPEFIAFNKGPLLEKIKLMNEQDNLIPGYLTSIEEVEKLDLGGFPEANNWQELTRYENLKRLDFWENSLSALPDAVFHLSKLEILYVCDELKNISPNIKQLQNLTHLQLEGNCITELPPEIGQLHQLQMLELAGNNLHHLPDTLMNLTNLKLVDVSGNEEIELSDKLKQWFEENVAEFYCD